MYEPTPEVLPSERLSPSDKSAELMHTSVVTITPLTDDESAFL